MNNFLVDSRAMEIIKNPLAIAVYVCLSFYSSNKKSSNITLNNIVEMCGISHVTAIKSINKLSELGLIRVERLGTKKGNIYHLVDKKMSDLPIVTTSDSSGDGGGIPAELNPFGKSISGKAFAEGYEA